MKAVIKFTNGFGQVEYYAIFGSFTKNINDAFIFDEVGEAEAKVHYAKNGVCCPPIWQTAEVRAVNISEA